MLVCLGVRAICDGARWGVRQMAGRMMAALVAGFAVITHGASAGDAALEGWAPPDRATLEALTVRLEYWLDANTAYPSGPPPRILFVSAQEAVTLRGRATARYGNGRVRGLYDPKLRTIYLVAPWDYGDLRDASVLLHEMVHHRQQPGRHWYCPAQQEEEAYRLQEAWLAGHGLESGFYWPAIMLASSCTSRDFHPD